MQGNRFAFEKEAVEGEGGVKNKKDKGNFKKLHLLIMLRPWYLWHKIKKWYNISLMGKLSFPKGGGGISGGVMWSSYMTHFLHGLKSPSLKFKKGIIIYNSRLCIFYLWENWKKWQTPSVSYYHTMEAKSWEMAKKVKCQVCFLSIN